MPSPILLTGLGAITPAGRDVASCWDALLAGRPALAPLTRFPLGGIACEIGGQIDPLPPEASATDSATALALHAAREALADAPAEGLAVITGSNFGALAEGADAMAGLLPPEHLRACNHAVVAERLAAVLGATGPIVSISLSCASGASALALAADWLRAGRATRVLAVGVDSLSLCAWSGLCSLRTMARDGVIRPFDAARGGTIFSEGACAIRRWAWTRHSSPRCQRLENSAWGVASRTTRPGCSDRLSLAVSSARLPSRSRSRTHSARIRAFSASARAAALFRDSCTQACAASHSMRLR